jgi:hypothetical protein
MMKSHSEEETPEEVSARMDAEIAQVVEQMKRTWPKATDFHVTEEEEVQILDEKDNVIAVITTSRLDDYYNQAERFS